jgi:hypothetical protein
MFALLSWGFGGTTLFLILGTTTAVSLILWIANSLNFQGSFAIAFAQSRPRLGDCTSWGRTIGRGC